MQLRMTADSVNSRKKILWRPKMVVRKASTDKTKSEKKNQIQTKRTSLKWYHLTSLSYSEWDEANPHRESFHVGLLLCASDVVVVVIPFSRLWKRLALSIKSTSQSIIKLRRRIQNDVMRRRRRKHEMTSVTQYSSIRQRRCIRCCSHSSPLRDKSRDQ